MDDYILVLLCFWLIDGGFFRLWREGVLITAITGEPDGVRYRALYDNA
jgi:hypothetical protein